MSLRTSAWRASLAALVTLLAVAPRPVGAEPGSTLSVDEAHAAFASAGYDADRPTDWSWLAPPVTTFQVHDRHRDRVLLVAVYSDAAQAELGHQGSGSRMGYSASTWIDNLAVFEAVETDYQRRMADAAMRSWGMQPDLQADETLNVAPPLTRADDEYVALLSGRSQLER